jgi:hypothetical protein
MLKSKNLEFDEKKSLISLLSVLKLNWKFKFIFGFNLIIGNTII